MPSSRGSDRLEDVGNPLPTFSLTHYTPLFNYFEIGSHGAYRSLIKRHPPELRVKYHPHTSLPIRHVNQYIREDDFEILQHPRVGNSQSQRSERHRYHKWYATCHNKQSIGMTSTDGILRLRYCATNAKDMLSARLRFVPLALHYRGKHLHSNPALSNSNFDGKDLGLSRGHVTNASQSPQHDPHSQSSRSWLDKHKGGDSKPDSQMDAALPDSMQKAPGMGAEKVGFADQVGSASGSSNAEKGTQGSRKNGSEEASSPSIFDALKKIFGFKTSSAGVKWNKSGGTGTGSEPPDSTRYVGKRQASAEPTLGQAPEASRKPKEKNLPGDQNEHLTHQNGGESDSGKGNAAEEPVLPSQRKERKLEGDDEPKRYRSGARG